jgi:hypothetical protein
MSNDNNTNNPAILKFDEQLSASKVRFDPEPHNPEREAEALNNANPTDMVQQVTKRIDSLKAALEKSNGFDASTGKPLYAIPEGDRRRQTMELELRHMVTSVLPYTQLRAAEVQARKGALPTQEQLLVSQAERQQRLAEAARKRAEELEVEEMAKRILASRRTGSGG